MNELLHLLTKGLIWIILIALFLFMFQDVERFLDITLALTIIFLILAIPFGIIALFIYLVRRH